MDAGGRSGVEVLDLPIVDPTVRSRAAWRVPHEAM